MGVKSERRLKLERSLAEDPTDTFLRYGLALQCLREDDTEEGRARLHALIEDHPGDQVAAHQQLGQSYLESGERDKGVTILQKGILLAKGLGDWHSAGEMQQLLDSMAS